MKRKNNHSQWPYNKPLLYFLDICKVPLAQSFYLLCPRFHWPWHHCDPLLLVLILAMLPYSVTFSQSQLSDSLFTEGVMLYHEGRYYEAIPLFAHCDSIDRAGLRYAQTYKKYNPRVYYAQMWLASCYFKCGEDAKAAYTYQDYMLPPIDRRLTKVSDSLAFYLKTPLYDGKQIDHRDRHKLDILNKILRLERKNLGKDTHWVKGTLNEISNTYLEKKDTTKAIKYRKKAVEISLTARGASSLSCDEIHKLQKLYFTHHESEFYNDIQTMLKRALKRANNDIRHDLAMEKAYLDLQEGHISTEKCRQLMEMAMTDCEHIHGKSSEHYALLSTNLVALLCSIGDYESALRYNDNALLHDGKAITLITYLSLFRDRMIIMLGLGKIDEASDIGQKLLYYANEHADLKGTRGELLDISSFVPHTSVSLSDNDLQTLKQCAHHLFMHNLPILCPTDERLVQGFSPVSPLIFGSFSRIILTVAYTEVIIARLQNSQLRDEALCNLSNMVSSSPLRNNRDCKIMPSIVEALLQCYQEASEWRKGEENNSYDLWRHTYDDFEQEKTSHCEIWLLLCVKFVNERMPSSTLPFYADYRKKREQLMAKPLDQLNPNELAMRRRFLLDKKYYFEELNILESLWELYINNGMGK